MNKQVFISSDHGGFKLKSKLASFLEKEGFSVEDLGPHKLNPTDDYPDYAAPLARKVVRNKSFGVLICRNGQGVCIAANKIKGVRAVTGFSRKEVEMTRKDDNANILCLPSDYISFRKAKDFVSKFLNTKFSNAPRHKRRINKIKNLEKNGR